MKIAPLAQGTGVPTPNVAGSSVTPDARARAIAAMTGQQAPEVPPPGQEVTGNPQADRILKSIKMKTQVSTNRHELVPEPEPQAQIEPQVQTQPEAPIASSDNNGEVAQQASETKPLSPQFAALVKARRALQQERAALEKMKADIEASKANSDQLAEYISKADLKSKPLSVLVDNGITYDQLTEAILNGQGPNAELIALKQQIDSVKQELTNQLAERDKLQEQQVLSQMRRDVDAFVSNSDKYKATQAAKAQSQVVDLIHRVWKQEGELLDISEAADLVEKQIRDEAMPFVDLLRPQPQPEPIQQVEAQPQPKAQGHQALKMRTLTNRDTASPGLDRRARAIAAMLGQKVR